LDCWEEVGVLVEGLKPPVRWLTSYFEDDDVLFYFEFDEDGWVLRQVELEGPNRTPTTAAALSEWPDPAADGLDAQGAYMARYGVVGDQPLGSWEPDFPLEEISADEFEEVWRTARASLEEKP
jgi:hypothetical protein